MYDFLCLFCQTKHHIKILTAVTFAAKQTYFFQQGLLKHGKMANVIIRPQIVNRKNKKKCVRIVSPDNVNCIMVFDLRQRKSTKNVFNLV